MKIKSITHKFGEYDGWLKQRFNDCFVQISNDTTLQIKSTVKDVARALLGQVPEDIEELVKKFLKPPQDVTDYQKYAFGYEDPVLGQVPGAIEEDLALREYIGKYPKHWEVVVKAIGLVRQRGRHPCAYIISDIPVSNFIPLTKVGEHIVSSFTMGSVEAAGGLKMDFLKVNSINDIQNTISLIQKRNNFKKKTYYIDNKRVPFIRTLPLKNGEISDIWDLPEDQDVYKDICEGRTETVFQFNTNGARKWLKYFNYIKKEENGIVYRGLSNIEDLSLFNALNRKGPLDYYMEDENGDKHNMLVEFTRRARGEAIIDPSDTLKILIPETGGIIVYQEQLQKIFQIVGDTTLEAADEFRVHISKKKGVENDKRVFMKGATEKYGEEQALDLWARLESFANYGFNKSHAVCYSVISYACAYLKHHYPLEWWCAVLGNADKDEINETFWPHCGHLIDLPDVNLSEDKFSIQNEKIRAPLTLLLGVGEGAHKQLCAGRPYKDIDDFCQKIEQWKKDRATPVLDAEGNPVYKEVKKPGKRKTKLAIGKYPGRLVSPVSDPEELEKVPKMRMGSNALNKTVVSNLITAQTMDSLFPPEFTLTDKIDAYLEAAAKASGNKKAKPNEAFYDTTGISQYLVRKKILPSFPDSAIKYIRDERLVKIHNRNCWVISSEETYTFASFEDINNINNLDPWPGLSDGLTVAVAAYIIDEKKFTWSGKEACEYLFDIDGSKFSCVKWADKKEKKLTGVHSLSLVGSVVVCVLNKWKAEKPFSIRNMYLIKGSLEDSKNEGSSD